MRYLAWVGFAFAGGCALAQYVLPEGWALYAAALAALLALPGALLLREYRRAAWLLLFLFLALGLGRHGLYYRAYMGAAAEYAGTTRTVLARVTEYPYRDGLYASVSVKLAEPGQPPLGIDVADYAGALPELRPGDLARLELEFIDATQKYGEETDVYAARGTHLRAYFVSEQGSGRDWRSLLYFPQELLEAMSRSVERCFPADVLEMMQGLLLGDTHGIYDDAELDAALSVTGVAHIVSVSGMHLGFLCSAMTRLVGRRRASAWGMPVVILFTLMAGCTPAVVRACVMQLLVMTAFLLGREEDGLTGLALSLLIILFANPMSIASVSLQLSFASVFGMVTLTPPIFARLRGPLPRRADLRVKKRYAMLCASIASSVGAQAFTLPIVAGVFGYVSLIAPIANLLTLWAASLAFTLGFSAALAGLALQPLGASLAWLAAWPARYFVWAVELLARVPFAAVYTADRLIVWWLAATYALFIAAWIFRGKAGLRQLVPALCSALLLAAVLISAARLTAREESVSVLDVGQGQSVVLLSGENAVVVDCGGQGSWDDAGDTAGEFLLSRGRRSIDALVLTHLHSDHANGAARLLMRVNVARLYIHDGADDSDDELRDILAAAERRGTEVIYVAEDVDVSFGGLEIRLLAPEPADDENERGIVIRASLGDYDAVITGDVGAAAERRLVESGRLGRAELLVAGHHGSRYSNSWELVRTLRPETVVVSVGYNSFGHPTEDALVRLSSAGAELYRTDENGTVTIRPEPSEAG